MNLLSSTLAVCTIIGITLMTVSNFNKAQDQVENLTSIHSAAWLVDETTRFTDRLKTERNLSDIAEVNYNNIIQDNDYITIEQVNDGKLSNSTR